MHNLTDLIKCDMRPALGVTEPGAIAFACSLARSHVSGDVKKVVLELSSGIYKNAFTCGIPNSDELGIESASSLGAVGGDYKKGLLCLDGITPSQVKEAKALVERGVIEVKLSEITSRISIKATVITDSGEAEVLIRDSHTNVVRIKENGVTVFEKEGEEEKKEETPLIHNYTLKEMLEYVSTVDIDEISFIKESFELNFDLAKAALKSEKGIFSKHLLKENGGAIISKDERKTAALLCSAAIEARVLGFSLPAMSITGSGAHGIIATMPLYASWRVKGFSEDDLLRATALSFLICMYIKEYSGKLSAFCGCAIAAGTGSAVALTYLRGGRDEEITATINNMASSITGMICDGGNHGCALKGMAAVDAAYRASSMALDGARIDNKHGINGRNAEETMRYIGAIASPGMTGTEKTILEILEEKGERDGKK